MIKELNPMDEMKYLSCGLNFLRRYKRPIRAHRVIMTDDAIVHVLPDESETIIRWDDLYEIRILTTDEGPFNEDVFYVLLAQDKITGCIIPLNAAGNEMLFSKIQKLQNFDYQAFTEAMLSITNNQFLCWQRTT